MSPSSIRLETGTRSSFPRSVKCVTVTGVALLRCWGAESCVFVVEGEAVPLTERVSLSPPCLNGVTFQYYDDMAR